MTPDKDHTQVQVMQTFQSTDLEENSHLSSLIDAEVTVIDETSLEYDFSDFTEDSACASLQATFTKKEEEFSNTSQTKHKFFEVRDKGKREKSEAPLLKFEDLGAPNSAMEKIMTNNQRGQKIWQQQSYENGFRCLTCNKLFISKMCFELHANGHKEGQSKIVTANMFPVSEDPNRARMTSIRAGNERRGSKGSITENTSAARSVRQLRSPNPTQADGKTGEISSTTKIRQLRSRKPKQQADLTSKKKVYWCHICKKRFNNFFVYLKHKKDHPPESPKTCHFCDKTFSIPSQFQRHIMIHTGEKPFVCVTCQKPYRLLGSLRKHARKCSSN